MGADDQAVDHLPEPPAGGDPFQLDLCILAIRSGADHRGIGAPFDLPEQGIIAAVEKGLHHPGNRGEIFRCRKNITVGGEHVIGPAIFRMNDAHFGAVFLLRSFGSSLDHLSGAAGIAVIDNQKIFHRLPPNK